MNISRFLAKVYINSLGWRTNHKYLLFESDDWGSIRMPNRKFYNYLLSQNYPVDKYYFDKYDSLERGSDLSSLFDLLFSFKDFNGNPAVFTPLCIVANPNFEKIIENGKSQYHFESTLETYQKYQDSSNVPTITQQGILSKVWAPQFHGREHIQINRYLKALLSNNTLEALCIENHAVLGFVNNQTNYFPAFAVDDYNDITSLSTIIKDGLNLFEKMYGYRACSFCPPCGIINTTLFDIFYLHGIIGLQAGQYFSTEIKGKTKHYQHYFGYKNNKGQIFTRRNCTFEPARNHNLDWCDQCLKEIEIAFKLGKPACINTHRVSYIGRIFEDNRKDSLKQLRKLLTTVKRKWPDVEFISSENLLKKMANDEN